MDDAWWPGEVRSWSPSRSGWWANCSWHRSTGETRLGTFHEDDVRRDTVDRSSGRKVKRANRPRHISGAGGGSVIDARIPAAPRLREDSLGGHQYKSLTPPPRGQPPSTEPV